MHLITANRLGNGVAVWLDAGQRWTEDIESAAAADEATLAASLEAARLSERDNVIVGAREIAAEVADGKLVPVERRERLRGRGPSVRPDLADKRADGRWDNPPFPEPPSATSRSPYAGIYRYDEYDRQYLRDRAEQFREQVKRRLSGELTEDEFKPLRLMNGVYLQLADPRLLPPRHRRNDRS